MPTMELQSSCGFHHAAAYNPLRGEDIRRAEPEFKMIMMVMMIMMIMMIMMMLVLIMMIMTQSSYWGVYRTTRGRIKTIS